MISALLTLPTVDPLVWITGLSVLATAGLVAWLRGQREALRRRRAREAWLRAAEKTPPGAIGQPRTPRPGPRVERLAREAARADVVAPGPHELARTSDVLEVLGGFAGGIANELGDLLTTVLGHVGLLEERAEADPELRSSLEEIRSAAEAGRRTTRQLLAFGRKGLRRSTSRLLQPLLESACKHVEARTGARFQLFVSPCAAAVEGSPDELKTLFEAVLENAGRAAQSGEVLVRAEAARDGSEGEAAGALVRIGILDDGPGIPLATRHALFEPGFTTRGEAAGLGLSIAATLASRNGGRLALRDARELGLSAHGTLAEVFLPRAHPAGVSGPRPLAKRGRSGEAGLVLVVEDDPHVRSLVRQMLERDGHRVRAAADAEIALELARGHAAELGLLLTDVALPGRDGLDLAARLEQLAPGLPVVYMSGAVEAEDLSTQLLGAAPYFLQKPFTPEELFEIVRRAQAGGRQLPRARVLVVDDEPTMRRFVRALVEEEGLECVTAENGAEALEHLGRARFDLVLTDIVMPVLDGLDLIRALQERHPGLRVVAMTGKSGGRPALDAAALFGVDGVLTKPFSRDEFTLVLRRALDPLDGEDRPARAA